MYLGTAEDNNHLRVKNIEASPHSVHIVPSPLGLLKRVTGQPQIYKQGQINA